MHVLIICEYYPPYIGGVEIVFQNIAERLAARGYEVTVLTTRLPNTAARETRNGVNIHRVKTPKVGDRFFFSLCAIPKAIKLARDADVIHTTTWLAPIPAACARKVTSTPTVMTYHESLSDAYAASDANPIVWGCARALERFITLLPFDRYTAVSENTSSRLRKLGINDEVTVVYNGIDSELFSEVDSENPYHMHGISHEFLFLYFGRPGFTKGVDHLLEAFSRFRQTNAGYDAHLFMILAPEPEDRYERVRNQIDTLSVADDVTVIDPVDRCELPRYIGYADCVVVPSVSEGFGFTAAETCAVGTPIITTTAGSLPEVVGGEHLVVSPGQAESLARAMESAYFGEFDREPTKSFGWESKIDQYVSIYRSIL